MQKAVMSEIPRGVGAPPPPGMDPRKGKGKLMCIKVRMLDDSVAVFHLGHKANGQALFDEVCRHLNLLESDYFGLEFIDGYGNRCWLEKDKSILRQITSAQSDARFYFVCKFYTPNPTDLEEEYTRYLLSLQIRRDLAQGELMCNENTAALLVSFIVQAECGDFSVEDYPDHTYLSVTNFVPNQTSVFQQKVMENHKKLIGMGPAEADLALLETARRCDFYGIKLHAAKDIEGTEVTLSVAHMGIKVFHQLNCISTFSWAKIRKLSFKRKRLMIKLHPESYQYYKETIEFNFDNRNECKNFWKKCVEHHAFFRCLEAPNFEFAAPPHADATTATLCSTTAVPSSTASLMGISASKKDAKKLFSHGSSFRYHGRTQKQLIDFVREHRKRREPFQRPLRISSNRSSVDPYGAIGGGGSAPRRIQFNINDPMLVSTTSSAAGGFSMNATEENNSMMPAYSTAPTASFTQQQQHQQQNSAAAGGGSHICCGAGSNCVLNQQQHYRHSCHPQTQQIPPSQSQIPDTHYMTPIIGNGNRESAQRYPEVYYPPGTKSYQQQQFQQQQFNHKHQNNYHYGNHPQPYQQPQNQMTNYHYRQQHHHPYTDQRQFDVLQKQQKQCEILNFTDGEYGNKSQRNSKEMRGQQRPKSVFASSTSDKTPESVQQPTAVMGGNGKKNHSSSGDVASVNATTSLAGCTAITKASVTVQRANGRMLREDSIPASVPEADEEGADASTSTNVRNVNRESSYHKYYPDQPTDQMSTSLPNVLAEDLKVLCQEYRNDRNVNGPSTTGISGVFFANPPPKSMSGDNFLDDFESTVSGPSSSRGRSSHHHRIHPQRGAVSQFIYDNMSEGSYRLTDPNNPDDGGNSSSTSDVGLAESLSSRVLSTTFTTKRVGNVIVKRVIDSNNQPRKERGKITSKAVEEDFDNEDESSYSEAYCNMSSVSAPASSRNQTNLSKIDSQRPLRQRVPIPVAIDGPPDGYPGMFRPSPPRSTSRSGAQTNSDRLKGDENKLNVLSNSGCGIPKTRSDNSDLSSSQKFNKNTMETITETIGTTEIRPIIIDNNDANEPSNAPRSLYSSFDKTDIDISGTAPPSILMRTRPVLVTPISLRNPGSMSCGFNGGNSNASSTFSTPTSSTKKPHSITTEHQIPVKTSTSTFTTSEEHQIPIKTISTQARQVPDNSRSGGTSGATTPNGGKPIVHGAKYTKLSMVVENFGTPRNSASDKNLKDLETITTQENHCQQQQQTKGIPGRVISKQNMVITPEGILPKEEIVGQKKDKPQVPPKPKGIGKSSESSTNPTKNDEVSWRDSLSQNEDELLAPLNKVLDDANQFLETIQATPLMLKEPFHENKNENDKNNNNKIETTGEGQDQIRVSVQSEDQPDVRKLHMFGRSGQIPYTLTLRSVETPKCVEKYSDKDPLQMMRKGKRQQPLDLVHRKQLPSQNSFSSQDHSISPTSPDSGNVVEYIMRRRSISSDRYQMGATFSDSSKRSYSNPRSVRKEHRCQTQPIRLSDCPDSEIKITSDFTSVSPSAVAVEPAPTVTQNNTETGSTVTVSKTTITTCGLVQAPFSNHQKEETNTNNANDCEKSRVKETPPKSLADDDSVDFPEPPPLSMLSAGPATLNTNEVNRNIDDEANKMAKKIVSGVLETDF